MTFAKSLLASALLTASATTFAGMIEGDVSGGATVNNYVSTEDGWITDSAVDNRVDFWSFSGELGDILSIAISSTTNTDFGISLYKGIVEDTIGFSFQYNSDFVGSNGVSATHVTNTDPFGDSNHLVDFVLNETTDYTIAVGGNMNYAFGQEGQYDYQMMVDIATSTNQVPVPAGIALLAAGLVGFASARRAK